MNAETTDKTKTGVLSDTDELARFTVEIEPELVKLCKDFGSHTQEAKTIYMTSRNIVRKIVGDETPEDRVRQRCVVATGDPGLADILQFNHDPIDAGLKAIKNSALVYVDVNMAMVGISKTGHNCEVRCILDEDEGAHLAHEYGITRTAAGFIACREKLEGAIIVIGNAPSAAITMCRLVEYGVRPALIVGTPVGFVNAARSKELIRELGVPSITCVGTRGGTPIAVACVNELIAIGEERRM
ncbi:MAG: precorrin-8X methylmutase [Deltaproteobacteria bacterium]|nr:precorrin-8X methylmutase [Deltaproteobacteria bacterium]